MKKIKRIAPEEISVFCSQWVMILRSGILLYDGIDLLLDTYEGSEQAQLFEEIHESLSEGEPFYMALKNTGVFPDYMVEMVCMGEQTGNLEQVFDSLTVYYKKEAQLIENVKNAVLYPLALIVMMSVVIAVLVLKVIPIFMKVFDHLGIVLDSMTQTILQAGIITGYVVMALAFTISVVAIVVLILCYQGKTQQVLHQISKCFPFLNKIYHSMAAGRYADILSMALKSGYSVNETIAMAADFMPNEASRKQALTAKKIMDEENRFSDALHQAAFYEPIHEKMIAIAEETGQIDQAMEQIAQIYSEQSQNEIDHLVSLIEPVLVAFLTLIVGGILLAIMLPLAGILISMT
ncbi:hypothetical protein C815_00856 [Firmicutes bacterium M10-2]|nr:hypothetical protein C815_00856 [Firmicutes bacterium M10-2]